MTRLAWLLPILLPLAPGCQSDDSDLFENIKKLRALGVDTCAAASGTTFANCTSAVAQPSTTAAPQVFLLKVYAALPLGTTVDVTENYTDPSFLKSGLAVTLQLVPGTAAYEEHGALRVFSAQVTGAVPTSDQAPIPPVPGFARVQYGVHLAGSSGDQKITGNLLVYPAGDPALKWVKPAVGIAAPAAGALPGGTKDLAATVSNGNAEDLRVGWFVDGGKIKNRRAVTTTWTTPGAGAHTLVLTARGVKSGAFNLKVVDVTVQ